MTRKRVVIVVAAVVVLAIPVALSLGFLNNLLGGDDMAHPPCEELPTRAEVEQAIEDHDEIVDRLTAVGDGVTVVVGQPCDDPDQALVAVRVSTDEENDGVREVLRESAGFGPPAIVEQRDD